MLNPTPADIARFWMQVVEEDRGYATPCWIYTGGTNGRYGQFYLKTGEQTSDRTRRIYAHRFAFFLATGEVPDHALHHCDVPLCCRFDHLFSGTQADNMLDSSSKGRNNKKLNASQRAEIAQRWRNGESATALAREFGVTPSLVYWIDKRY